jgi:multimeric flavodoxin WrbA
MHILGLSGGRTMGNSEVLLREALTEAQKLGATVELIRLIDLSVKPPITATTEGEMMEHRLPDHTSFIGRKLRECDALILACPAYCLSPSGFVTNIRDRVSLRGLRPEKLRVGAMIAVGGTDWVSLMLPMMYLVFPHGEFEIVDQMVVTYHVGPGAVVLDEKSLARARRLGRSVGEALKLPAGELKYVGDEYWTCPICRQNLLKVRGKFVECPICDIQGTIQVKEGGIKVTFTEEGMRPYRWGPEGSKRHGEGTRKGHATYREKQAEIKEKLKKYEGQIPATVPPPIEAPPPMRLPDD